MIRKITMNAREVRWLQVLLIVGTFVGSATGKPVFGAGKPAVRHSMASSVPVAGRVVHASHASDEAGSAGDSLEECPPDARPARCKWWCWDCRPHICATWYAHHNYACGRFDAWKWRHNYHPVRPGYADPRNAQVYSAEGYGVPVSAPLAPVTGDMWNYGYGVPAARITPLGPPPY